MSATPTSHDGGLDRVVQAGLDYAIEGDTLTVAPVPYRTSDGSVAHGALICHLERQGSRLAPPSDHTVGWVAEGKPHFRDGRVMESLIHNDQPQEWANGERSICGMSRKRHDRGYVDFGEKMVTYARLIARQVGDKWSRDTIGSGETREGNNMVDQETGLTRSGVGDMDKLFRQEKIAVIGAGGTGGFIVDMVSKCNVDSIDIYDPDLIDQHTQLRWPGVVGRDVVEQRANKAEYLARVYASRTNRNIRGHAKRVGKAELTLFSDKTIVFVAIDSGADRRVILSGLAAVGANFIDCGIDLHRGPDGISASTRVVRTFSGDDDATKADLVERTPGRDIGEGMYEAAIQTVEINALNATLAVVAWKQGIGFYKDAFGHRRMRLHVASTTWAGYDGADLEMG